jgi:class 3 adenylate cyclase
LLLSGLHALMKVGQRTLSSTMALIEMPTSFASAIEQLERAGWAAELWSADWRLAWVSPALKAAIGEQDDERLGIGLHWIEARWTPTWLRTVTDGTRRRAIERELPQVAAETPGGVDTIRAMAGPEVLPLIEHVEPVAPPPVWTYSIDFVQGSLRPVKVVATAVQLRDEGGERLGTVAVYGPGLAPALVALVARGNPGMFERMARLIEPARHRTAILFADLQASSVLSRRLSSASYFDLIKTLTTAIDNAVVKRLGIVGRHAGDGVTAFFLANDVGSASAAARATIEAGRAIGAAAERVGAELEREHGSLAADEVRMNVGVHWGGALYLGQVVTGGRLEVTALGDEVNEAARIQESARDGALLASKSLLERLDPDDAVALGLDPDRTRYRTLAELDGVTAKARRDAGTVAVTAITP